MGRYVLALDFGHGGGKALFLDLDSKKSFLSYSPWEYYSPEDDSYRKEFLPGEFFEKICSMVKGLVNSYKIKPEEVVGISTASMRHAYIFLDKDGKEVYGGPNTDIRGLFYQDVIEQDVKLDLYNLTGQGPPLMYMPARLLWFKNEKPEIFKNIHCALSIGDWLTYRLTGVIATEPSLASATLLYNIGKRKWLSEVMEVLGLNSVNLPEVHYAGEHIGGLTNYVAKKMNLREGTPVALGGGDTHLGLLACSAYNDGDICVVAGTSTPVMMVMAKPVIDEKRRVWTGCHILKDRWVLEGNAQMGGLSYSWLKNNFKVLLGRNDKQTYTFMENLAKKVPPGSDDMIASLGAEIFNLNEINVIRPAIFKFQQPAHLMNTCPATFGHFIRATLENISFAVRGNILQMEEITNKKNKELKVTGGMSRSSLWLEILSGITGKKVLAVKEEDGTLMGCAICAAVGAGIYDDFDSASKEMVEFKKDVVPNEEQVEIYSRCYNNWKEWYDKIGSM